MSSSKRLDNEEKILSFINEQIEEFGYPPSVREICAAVGLKSTSSVHSYLVNLEKKGLLKKGDSKNRALSVVSSAPQRRPMYDIPIVGRVAAGQPILATENIEDYLTLTSDMIKDEDSFLLRVSGESMIEAGILDGDLIIVHSQSTVRNGEIAVALIEDSATVKTFYNEGNRIRLQPENSTMDPIYVEKGEEFMILGRVTGVLRLNI